MITEEFRLDAPAEARIEPELSGCTDFQLPE